MTLLDIPNMSNGKRVRFAHYAAQPKYQLPNIDLEWENKVLREVIYPEIYERYGPNATQPQYKLAAKDLEDLRREVYCEEQQKGLKQHGTVKHKVPQSNKSISKATTTVKGP